MTRLTRIFTLLLVVALCAPAATTTRPIVMGTHGMAASGHPLAARAGMKMLEQGGNAVDAGIAQVLAQAVLEFNLFGVGGECPILIYSAKDKKVFAISGQGVAPKAATIEWFKKNNIELIPDDGFLPATTPAVVDSIVLALDRFGTMTFAQVAAPAIDLAENGFPMYGSFRSTILQIEPRLHEEWPSSAKVFLPDGKVPAIGDVFVQKDLARTLKRLVEAETQSKKKGRSAGLHAVRERFYKGDIAREIVKYQREFKSKDSNGFVSAGLFTEEDLASYQGHIEEPAKVSYRGIDVYKLPFWSQGPVMLEMLNLLEGYDLASLRHNTADYVHLVAEAAKLAYADREQYYGDPAFVKVPSQGLLSKDYAKERRKLIDLGRVSMDMRPGDPYPFETKQLSFHLPPPPSIEFRPGEKGTTGTRAADHEGNLFSATPSGGWFRTSPILEGLGFVLPTRGQIFWLDASKPNALLPGKRPRTTLTPSLALRNGQPYMVFGTPGGDDQDQVNLQFFLNVVDFGMDIQSAIDAPNFQILQFPSSFFPRKASPGVIELEGRFAPRTLDELTKKGHLVKVGGDWSGGDETAIMYDAQRKVFYGAASPRREKSYAMGW
jgi:gamma-glutamyltranspeptidase/glutathione hydrolase